MSDVYSEGFRPSDGDLRRIEDVFIPVLPLVTPVLAVK
jgi:hypothetical protein